MSVSTFIQLYLLSLLVFLVIDMLWLGIVARKFYRNQLGILLKKDVNWVAAVLFYLLFVLGIVVFVIIPAYEAKSWQQAAGSGALFGLVTYATYDLTNQATLKNWPLKVTIIDLL